MNGIYKGEECPIPEGYTLKEPDLVFDKELNRYLWHPDKGDFIYYPDVEMIFEYMEWKDGYFMSMDGYARLKDIETKKEIWVTNIIAREGIPLVIR